jgi:hypothetical protein
VIVRLNEIKKFISKPFPRQVLLGFPFFCGSSASSLLFPRKFLSFCLLMRGLFTSFALRRLVLAFLVFVVVRYLVVLLFLGVFVFEII